MPTHLFRRLGYSLLVLWGVATLVFLLFNVLPADPARLTLGQRSDLATVAAARKELHLDQPLFRRYVLYLNDISPIGLVPARKGADAPWNFSFSQLHNGQRLALKVPYLGRSYRTKRLVSDILWEALPGTVVLAFSAMLFASFLGIALGILAALKKGSFWDTGAVAASVAGISLPSFFAGLIIAYVFGMLLHAYTGLDMTGSLYEWDAFGGKQLALRNLILPAFALGIRPLAIITQLTRSSMLDVLGQDYIRTAKAKGLSRWRMVTRHALPNALNPVVTAISGWMAELLAGSFFIEYIFGWKGVGKVTVDALDKFDFPLVMASVLLSSLIFIVVNFLTDLLYMLLDPRVRTS
ncbi:MAG: ABC transporter permease [Bacteroidetes bacterium]|nr:ABC transporter permease [Bacteroidota bacterium]